MDFASSSPSPPIESDEVTDFLYKGIMINNRKRGYGGKGVSGGVKSVTPSLSLSAGGDGLHASVTIRHKSVTKSHPILSLQFKFCPVLRQFGSSYEVL